MKTYTFEYILIMVSIILYNYKDKKDRKKRLLKLQKISTPASWLFVSTEILPAANPVAVLADAVERYYATVDVSHSIVEMGAQGMVIYMGEGYPVFLKPDTKLARNEMLANEEQLARLTAAAFNRKYTTLANTSAIVAFFTTSGFSGTERRISFNDAPPKARNL